MKKCVILFIAIFAYAFASAQKVDFFDGTWQEANDLAANENKFIFVDAYTEWCGWCKVMDKETFTDPKVYPFINENFVPMKIDFEDSLGIVLSMKFRVWAYPTTMIFNSQGQLVGKISGYNDDHLAYVNDLKSKLEIKEERVFAYDSRQLDLPYPEIYTQSFKKGKERKWPADSVVTEYLMGQEDLFSEVNWSVILKFHPKEYLDHVVNNREKYNEMYGEEEVSDILQYYIYNLMQGAATLSDRAALDKALALCDYLPKPEQYKFFVTMAYYQQTKDWPAFTDALGTYIDDGNAEEYLTINNYCWTIYENVDERDILQKAINWMKAVIEADPLWMSIDTYAALLYKYGNYEEALIYADIAIETGKKAGEDVSSSKELREKIVKAMKE